MFGWEFPPHISGGLGTACYGLTSGLLQQGITVDFVVPRLFGGEKSQRNTRLIDSRHISIPDPLHIWEKYRGFFNYLEVAADITPYLMPPVDEVKGHMKHEQPEDAGNRSSWSFPFSGTYGPGLFEEVRWYALAATEIATQQQYDLIHAHDWPAFPAGIAAKAASGKPLIAHVHATEFDRSGKAVNEKVYAIERAGMEAADRIIAVSHYTRKIIIDQYGIDPARVVTIHNGIIPKANEYLREQPRPVKEKIVTFLGRVTFQKGPEYFIEAAKRVLDHDKNVRFVMAGSGDMLQRMIDRAAAHRISSRCHFTGFLNGPEVERILAMTDVFVMPSVSEPFGIAPLEALQAHVPVIISKQSGVSEVLRHAIKIDFWDIDALSDAIYGLLKHSSLWRTYSMNGREELAQLTWEIAAEKVKQLYENTIQISNP